MVKVVFFGLTFGVAKSKNCNFQNFFRCKEQINISCKGSYGFSNN